jgi:hypothetical protein
MTFQQTLRRILADATLTVGEQQAAITALVLAAIGNDIRISPAGDYLTTERWKGYNEAHQELREAITAPR